MSLFKMCSKEYSKHLEKHLCFQKHFPQLGQGLRKMGILPHSATAPVIICNFAALCLPLHAGDSPLIESLSSFPSEKHSTNYCCCFMSKNCTKRDYKSNMNKNVSKQPFLPLVCLAQPLCWSSLLSLHFSILSILPLPVCLHSSNPRSNLPQ